MKETLSVKEHLRNEALYRPLSEPSPVGDWKGRLFYQHSLHTQLKAALWEKPHYFKQLVCISVPIICIVLVFTSYFGFLHPGHWFECIVPVVSLDIPPIGLKEVLIFVAIVNALTFVIRERLFAL